MRDDVRRAAACAVVLDGAGRLLLHRRTDNGLWSLPGGGIELGETAEQAVVREVREETGYEVEVVRLIGVYSQPEHTTIAYPDGNVVAYVSVAFECSVTGGAPALSAETSAVDWFDPAALPEQFMPGHVPRVRDALARRSGGALQRYEAWLDPHDGGGVSFGPALSMADHRARGLLSERAELLYSFEAATWEEASSIHNLRMGWQPYRPIGDPAPCPRCGAFRYLDGSAECWRCSSAG